ncbi:Fe-S cluster assembly sulfur transfer protein SufU [Cryobacterium sp. SO1]|uniref:Fe-S cluster assembly sulfur transfer protein SufU n=1 Tax=Cryobacterium sp. SO1 TaxID=1897061 RepID=UPI0010234FFD|nr:SUF system NifU family Fe-S cluster assembly protein [Cryobacterium sp. SO1]RZI35072.1 Iron-sulfur cluster assembly scaffold protein IscU [Cryobacterium sp. SO1]
MTSSAMQQLYQQIILDHAKSAHGAVAELSALDADAASVAADGLRQAQSHQVNTTCGDEITVRVGLTGTGAEARIDGFGWRGAGCSISMASASVLSDTVRGTSVAESDVMLDLFREMLRSRGTIEPDEEVLGDAAAFAGVSKYPARVKCAMLPWVAFEAALLQLR